MTTQKQRQQGACQHDPVTVREVPGFVLRRCLKCDKFLKDPKLEEGRP